MKNVLKYIWMKFSNFIKNQWNANKKRFIVTTTILSLIVVLLVLSVTVKVLINKNRQDTGIYRLMFPDNR